MTIPKTIYQTFKTSQLPFINRWFISRFKKRNPEYRYEFYDDNRIEQFLKSEFEPPVFESYNKIQLGAARADFFRYAVLYKYGGVYLDIDSNVVKRLDDLVLPDDVALISPEPNPEYYLQWALIFAPGHPFLERTLKLVMENIETNRYPYDVHSMTGPGVYSRAIRECLSERPNTPYRTIATDYNNYFAFRYPLARLMLYKKGEHWKDQVKVRTVLK